MADSRDGGAARGVIVRASGAASGRTVEGEPTWDPRLARRTTGAVTTTDRRTASAPERDRRLLRQVAAGSVDVRVHGERVERAVAAGDADAAWSALVDAFVLLGTRARSVRQRLLFSARDVIGPVRYAALRERLQAGLTADQPIPPAGRAVRHRGAVGWADIVGAPERAGAERAGAEPLPDLYQPEDHLSGVVQRLALAMSGDGQARRLGGTWGSITLERVGQAHLRVDPGAFDEACRRRFVRGEHRLVVGWGALRGLPVAGAGPSVRDEVLAWPDLAWELAARCSGGRPLADATPDARWRLVRRPDVGELYPVAHAARLTELLVRPSTAAELGWHVGDDAAVHRFLAAARAFGAVREVAPDEDVREGSDG
ncbi:MAG: hypothetical protein HYX34_07965 [Actinobacteria bacterium]|nr:hypothetical protein [Actinomycetota bacterium]